MEEKSGVCYKIPLNCGKIYIGETERPWGTRLNEHKTYVRDKRVRSSAVLEHLLECQETCECIQPGVQWDQCELIDQEKNKQKLQVLESIHIKMNQANAINRKGGDIDGSWDKVIDHYSTKGHLMARRRPGRSSQALRIQRQERRLHQEQLRREQGAS